MTAQSNEAQLDAWNGESGHRWVATADRRDAVLGPIGDLLLRHARIQAGESVLDIGCGCGATSLAAAAAVGSSGVVVGLDLSGPMLEVARRRAAQQAIDQLRFVQADAQVHAIGHSFDAAISRFGTMFFADPVAAFRNVSSHLRAGGRLCIATWQPLVANEWLTVPGAALLPYGTLPEEASSEGAGMFAQSDPDAIGAMLHAAGFADVHSTPETVPTCIGATVEDALDHLTDSGPGRAVLETVPEADRDTALAAVAAVLADHRATDGGVSLGAAVWITTARLRES